MQSSTRTAPPPTPASTLVLFREGRGAPEHLFVERASKLAFAGGAIVFPGGRIDPADHDLAARYPDLDVDDAAARVATVRETIEETGVAVGFSAGLDVVATRKALAHGASLAAIIDAAGVSLDLSGLTYFARWCPNFNEQRNFDTRFYIVAAPDGFEAQVDGTENVRLFWSSAQAVLDRADAGDLRIIFPTRRNLERLATLGSLASAVDHARRHPVRTITPWIEHRDGAAHLCIPDDLGYPVASTLLSLAR